MEKILNYLGNRLREYSTWAGLMLVAGSFGLHLTPEQQIAIAFLGMSLAGATGDQLKGAMSGLFTKVKPALDPAPVAQKPTAKTLKEITSEDQHKTVNALLDEDFKV